MRIYAIQVASGQEAKVEELIRRFIDESMIGEIFVPRFESMRRWKGEWHKRTERLTPGYLYVETSDAEKLALQLRRISGFNCKRVGGMGGQFLAKPALRRCAQSGQ